MDQKKERAGGIGMGGGRGKPRRAVEILHRRFKVERGPERRL